MGERRAERARCDRPSPASARARWRARYGRALAPGSGVEVATAASREANIDKLTSEGLSQLGIISTLLVLAAIMALAAALASSINQRRRAMAGLRLAGASPARLRRILLAEAGLMLGAGCVTGALAGIYGQFIIDAYLRHVTGFPVASAGASARPLEIFAIVLAAALAVCAIPAWLASTRLAGAGARGGVSAMGTLARARTLRALAVANARYWPTVAPEVRRELEHGRQPAERDPRRPAATLALAKLARRGLQRRGRRDTRNTRAAERAAARPCGRSSRSSCCSTTSTGEPSSRPRIPREGERLFEPFIDALARRRRARAAPPAGGQAPRTGRTSPRSRSARASSLFVLPAATQVAAARAGLRGALRAGTDRIHAAASLGEQQLEEWAHARAQGAGLSWREYTAGCASSVLPCTR